METRIKFWILPLLVLVFVYKIILLQLWNNVVHNQRDGSIDIKRILDIIYIMLKVQDKEVFIIFIRTNY